MKVKIKVFGSKPFPKEFAICLKCLLDGKQLCDKTYHKRFYRVYVQEGSERKAMIEKIKKHCVLFADPKTLASCGKELIEKLKGSGV
ncbi:MAG: hypothetical protein V3W20_12585 [Candidatus Neomarinimicrobiota bacterium]